MSANSNNADSLSEGWLGEQFEPNLVSVIVPAYNRERWIGKALDSIQAQTWPKVEIIVVDDGSTDGTAKLLQERCRVQAGHPLQVITQANAGVGAARNAGARAARGEFIIFHDSDDMLFPKGIQNYVECLIAENAEYCFSPVDSIDEHGELVNDSRRFYPKVKASNFLMGCFWLANAACYRRRVLNAAGPWNTTLPVAEDYELLWRIKITTGRGFYLERPQGVYRQHSRDQLHHQIDQTGFYNWKLVALGLFVDWLRKEGRWNREIGHVIIKEYRFVAVRLALQGDMKGKNRALRSMQLLCREFWHPLGLFGMLRFLNVKWIYQSGSQFRYRRHLRRQRESMNGEPARSKKLPSLLFFSPMFPNAEGIDSERRAEMVIQALSKSYQVTLLVLSSRRHAKSKPVAPDYLGGRWAHVPFEESRWLHFHRILESRFSLLYRLCGKFPLELIHSPKRCTKARLAFDGQQFEVVHANGLAVAQCALKFRHNQSTSTQFYLDLDDNEESTNERLARRVCDDHEHEPMSEYGIRTRDYARAEQKLLRCFDRVLVTSEKERVRFSQAHPDVRLQA